MKAVHVEQGKYLTRAVTLPVSGLEAEIREGDGFAERILYGEGKGIAQNLPSYWAALTIRLGDKQPIVRDDILGLMLPDQHVLAVEIWRLNYGDTLELSGPCDGCGDPAAYEVPLDRMEMIPMPAGGPVFEMVLPRSGKKVQYSYLTGAQELQNMDGGIDPIRLDHACIRAVNAEVVPYEEIRRWCLADLRAFRKARAKTFCGYDTQVRFTHKCGRRLVIDLLSDPTFLVPGIAGLGDR